MKLLSVSNSTGDFFDAVVADQIIRSYRPLLLLLQVGYVLMVLYGQKYVLKLRLSKEFVRDATLMWNTMNACFSFYFTLSLLPEFIFAASKGWFHTICRVDGLYTGSYSGKAMYIFTWSKVWGLGDTVLLILRGRDIQFMHLFHHTVVVVEVFFTYLSAGSMARLGVMMNVVMHSLMYSYFVAQDINLKVRELAGFITLLQLAQFVMGCLTILSAVWYMLHGQTCETQKGALLFHFAAYLSFFLLFGDFFYRSFVARRKELSRKSSMKPIRPRRSGNVLYKSPK